MNHSPTHTESKPKTAKPNVPFFTPAIQKKLSVGASNDSYEVEADTVADKVMKMQDTEKPTFSHSGPLIQKKCTHCEEEEERIRKKPLAESITPIVQKSALQNGVASHAPSHLESQIHATRGAGSLMDSSTRDFMENRFGVDFSDVRIHTNSSAVQMSQELHAQAFTVGNDVYFNEGKYSPNTDSGKHLLAHELTHTVQQSGSEVKKLQKKTVTAPVIQRNVFGDIGRGIGRAASTAWDYTGGAVIRFGGRVIEWVEDRAIEIINSIAPGLIDFLRSSIWEPIRDLIASGLDAMTGGLFSRLQEEGLSGVLHSFVDGIILSLQGEIADACRSFALLADKIFNFLAKIGSGALGRLRDAFNTVSGVLSSIWTDYAKPVMEAIAHYAGAAWDWIVEKARWVWELIEPIRNAIERAWNWIKRMFGIAWEGASSVWDWIVEKATRAWNWIKEAIEPIRVPLMIIGGIILLLSPLGPFLAIGAAAYGIYRAVQWVRANWNNEVFVRFRNTIRHTILDPIMSGIQTLQNLVSRAALWLSGAFMQLQNAFNRLVAAIASSTIFRILAGIVRRVTNVIVAVANFIVTQCIRIINFIVSIAQRVWTIIRPVVSLITKLLILALNPWLIPIVVAAWYWRLLPDCFKPPIINFVLRVMIGVLRAMPNFARFGDSWMQVKNRIIQFLQQILTASDEEKITAANRVARMVSEMDLSLLSNQISAARGAPAEFEGQMEEELLGVNLTTALPFELSAIPVASLQNQFQASGLADSVAPNDAALFNRTTYTDQDIGVNSQGTFEPSDELQRSIVSRAGGGSEGTVEFGNSEDSSRTVHGILSEMIPANSGDATGAADANATGTPSASPPMSHEEETEMRLQQMMAQSNEEMARQACTPPASEGARGPEGATGAFPEEAKFGPLTRGQRGRYTMNQMSSGMGHWWRCNRNWLIPTIIGVIIVIVLAEILTGGAVTAALPAIFGALTPIMIGVAVLRASYYLGEYVYKSISGDIAGASKALARGFAVAAVEAIFALLGSATFWKSLRGGVSSAGKAVGRAAGSLVRGTGRVIARTGRLGAGLVRTVAAGSRYVMRTAGAVIARGRLILDGVRGRIGQGLHSLEELSERLFSRVRFRRFRMRFTRGWFRLEGYINPWVLLATGRLEYIEQSELRLVGHTADDTVRLGDSVIINGTRRRGIVVGVHGRPTSVTSGLDEASGFVNELNSSTRGGRSTFRDLEGLTLEQRLAYIQSRESTQALRRGIPTHLQAPNFQAHHVVPRELRAEFDSFFRSIGFDIENGARNGIMVPPDLATRTAAITANPSLASHFGNSAYHLGSHPLYTSRIERELITIRTALTRGTITEAQALGRVDAMIGRARTAISNGGGTALNNITF
jgi:Domain of unknown function (DUF4157)/A nuclease family of the HNH/ENDO VII superfamily with conserved AHH